MRCLNCMKEFDEVYGVCPFCGFIPGTPPREAYHLYPGIVLKNRYIIGTTVGFGGFGITYRAWDRTLDRKVAIKEYYPNGVVNRVPGEKSVIIYSGNRADEFENGKRRFLDEARNMTNFSTHPNIVNVYEFFEENNTAYIAMEFLEGMSYKQYIASCGGKVSRQVAVSVVLSVLDALKEIHKAKIIHRDVSPDNIFMVPVEPGSDHYKVKLIDFGAARFSTGEEEKTLSIILKPGYAPPEQYRSKSRQGPWTDIYAVGAVLYRSITGKMPEESVNRMVEDHLQQPIQLEPSVPQYLNDTIMRAMALNQELRFQNVDQFRDALQQKTKVLDVDAELRRRKLKRGLSIAGICVALLGAGAGVFGIYQMKQRKLYNLTAEIAVEMPDVNGMRSKELAAAGQMGAEDAQADSKVIELEATDEMLKRMLEEYDASFANVSVDFTDSSIIAADDYPGSLRIQSGTGALPDVLETSGITEKDKEIWENLGSLDITYATIDDGSYYFMKDKAFKAAFETEKKQIPISFRAPVLYVNTHIISDEEKLKALEHLNSVSELTGPDGEMSFCVSSEEIEMYRKAFSSVDDTMGMTEFQIPGKDQKGYEPFLRREKAYYLGTTDDYEAVRASLGGIYKVLVMEDLQESGRIRGQFTHLWSINGSLTDDKLSAADSMIFYLMSETAQDVFNVQNGNGLSMNKNMFKTYVKSNDEFKEVEKYLDKLQMDYGERAES